jgi:tetraacyldisaccharide 4'-kinase
MRPAPAWWSHRSAVACALLPFSLIFGLVVRLRASAYRRGWLRRCRPPVFVLVVGNLNVGGSGKTPVVVALAHAFAARGIRCGIVSRGYGGSVEGTAAVPATGDPARYGDEPVLLARETGVPVVVGRARCAAVAELLRRHPDVRLVLADDGLQHLRLERDFELVVLDRNALGNGWLLPAGPLREPLSRLRTVDAVVAHDPRQVRTLVPAGVPLHGLRLEPEALVSLDDPSRRLPLAALSGRRVHAVAGIGRPERFFATLRALGAEVVPHAFPDHHPYRAEDLDFGAPGEWRIFTSKDAVKCRAYARPHDWVLTVRARLDETLVERILERIHGHSSAGRAGVPAVQGAAQIRP